MNYTWKNVSKAPHAHVFNQDQISSGERRTLLVVVLSGLTMLVEITSGVAFGSIALLADWLHMASHSVALGISVFAYLYARRYAGDERFNFSTGKVNSLAGFTNAIVLVGFAFFMIWESVGRLMNPVKIAFDQAIIVAVIGLMVNIISAYILGEGHDREHHHDSHQHSHHHDHNLRGAYLHVLADAMTSVLAITALLVCKYLGWFQLDALMGIVGALVVTRWAWGLIRKTSGTLLDKHIPEKLRRQVIDAI